MHLVHQKICLVIFNLRNIYFNRLTSKVDIKRTYEIFRWIDTSLTTIIESLIPKSTQFLGINYVIEPHILERAKHRYGFEKMYTLAQGNNTSTELLFQIAGSVKSWHHLKKEERIV